MLPIACECQRFPCCFHVVQHTCGAGMAVDGHSMVACIACGRLEVVHLGREGKRAVALVVEVVPVASLGSFGQ